MFSSVKLLLRREELQLLKEITNLEIVSFDGDLNQSQMFNQMFLLFGT